MISRDLYLGAAISFLAGAALGSLTTWFCVKKKYEHIAQEEIDSVKEVFGRNKKCCHCEEEQKEKEDTETRQTAEEAREKPDIFEYAKKLREVGYNGESEAKKYKVIVEPEPYVISPEEFGCLDDYVKVSLTYYADGILADENDEIMDEDYIREAVGEDFGQHFGEYEDDSVFIRNEEKGCDYEILADLRTYDEVCRTKPRPVEVQ